LVLQICTISEAFLVAAARVDYEATLFVTTSVITFLQSIGLDILNLEGKKKLNIFSFSLLSSLLRRLAFMAYRFNVAQMITYIARFWKRDKTLTKCWVLAVMVLTR